MKKMPVLVELQGKRLLLKEDGLWYDLERPNAAFLSIEQVLHHETRKNPVSGVGLARQDRLPAENALPETSGVSA